MTRDRMTVFGRDGQWDRLNAACSRDIGSLLMLRGFAGEGKSTLLTAASAGWQKQGVHVLAANTADGAGALDALLDGVRRLLERGNEPQLVDAVAVAAHRRRELDSTPERPLLPFVHELTRAIGLIAGRRRTVVIIEDADRCGPELTGVLCPLVQRLRSLGVAVFASLRAEDFPSSLCMQLLDLADEVVDLSPLSDAEVGSLLSRWGSGAGRAKLDQTVVEALRGALGELFGNPGTMLATLADLQARERLVRIDEHYCLTPVNEPIALPEQHPLVTAIANDGDDTERLVTVLALPDHVGVDDLPMLTAAAAVGLDASGRVLDRLVSHDVVRMDEEDRVRFPVPALAATLRRRAGYERVRVLHTALARQLLAQLERGGGVNRTRLADHLVHARDDVGGEHALEVLIDEAELRLHSDPARAASWCHGALRRLSTQDERWPRLLRTLLRLRTSLGQYRELADDVRLVAPAALASADRPAGSAQERRTLLVVIGMCWLSALLQDEQATRHEESARLFASLGGGSRFDAEVRRFASAMFGGRLGEAASQLNTLFGVNRAELVADEPFFDLGEVLVLLNAVSSDHTTFQHAWSLWQRKAPASPAAADPEPLRQAGSMTDYATALELILGEDYGRPSHGSVFGYQQVLRAYLDGEWNTALSLTRRMETNLPPRRSAPARYLARAIAAEICSSRGENHRAAEWLDRIPRIMDGGHVVAWVRCGVRYRAGNAREALHEGWQDYLRYRDRSNPAGLERLLSRLFEYATRRGETAFAEQLLAELTALDSVLCSTTSGEAMLVARARAEQRPDLAEQAFALAHRRGDVPQTARVQLVIGAMSQEPGPWLHDAYVLAKRLGWQSARSHAQELMRERGVGRPRSRTPRQQFSSIEMRIIDLVSDGFTNRQIAVAVRASEKTVESHLTRLFARTGCRSRVELTAALLEGRLVTAGP